MTFMQKIHALCIVIFPAITGATVIKGYQSDDYTLLATAGIPSLYWGMTHGIAFIQERSLKAKRGSHYAFIFAAITTMIIFFMGGFMRFLELSDWTIIGALAPGMICGLISYAAINRIEVRVWS